MKVSYNWLKNYVKTDLSVEKIASILTETGLEVEGVEKIETVKGGLEGLVVGKVLNKEIHPDADKLSVTIVDVGQENHLQIVCGAPNVNTNQKVIVATVGAILYPNPDESFKIKKSKIRGVDSEGMICAEDEIGLGKSHDGIMVLDENAKIGQTAKDYFKFEDDFLIEIGLTPNRADAMGHIGVVRDLVAYLNFHNNLNLKLEIPKTKTNHLASNFNIKVENKESAPVYFGGIIKNIQVKPSPEWLQNRLRIIGLKPINNIVDITNFIMMETGNPLHAFDLKTISKEVIVRNAKKGELLTTLDGVERKLHENDLIICDENTPLCLAGVFGGEKSGVSEHTKDLFIEAAYFNPISVRKSAKRHGLNTDASFRFERGVNPQTVDYSLFRAIDLILELAGGDFEGISEGSYQKIEMFDVEFDFDRCRKLIGVSISDDEIKKILHELDIEIVKFDNNNAKLKVPPYRVDVKREADVVEEVLRIYGFNSVPIPEKLNSSIITQNKPNKDHLVNIVSDLLVNNGYYEILNNSLIGNQLNEKILSNNEAVTILNPLSSELNQMRKSLLMGGLQTISYNQNRQNPNLRLFEFGKSYFLNDEKYIENQDLSILISGKSQNENWIEPNSDFTFYHLKGVVEAILKKLGIWKNIQELEINSDFYEDGYGISIMQKKVAELGWIKKDITKAFDIKNKVFFAILNWDNIIELTKINQIKYKLIPKTQFVRRDFSLLLDKSIKFSEIVNIAQKIDRNTLREISLFDVYEGEKLEENKKSYTVKFIFQDDNKTLEDKYIDNVMSNIFQELNQKLKAELR